MTGQLTGTLPVAKRKSNSRRADDTPDRFEMRVDSDWMARVQRQADRLGISAAAYIRQATTRQLEVDERTDPAAEQD